MSAHPSNTGTTRRCFIKRSVVAAVAVSSMTIFSGLVNAALPGSTGTETKTKCTMERTKACEEGTGWRRQPDGTMKPYHYWMCFYKCSGKNGEYSIYCDKDGKVDDVVPEGWSDDCKFSAADTGASQLG